MTVHCMTQNLDMALNKNHNPSSDLALNNKYPMQMKQNYLTVSYLKNFKTC